ncbi:MAG: 2-dehydropantoate 2-reductase [Burkholderiales bacterium]|nr:2-dehydropantoate 2-reductase [Burkholderiales bacterium]
MHIVFVGAGGIGGYFGARLIQSGAGVSFVARGRHAQAIREQGLKITSPLGGTVVQPLAISDDPTALAPADLVVFTVKLPDAEGAAALLAPLVRPGTVVLPLQNGVDIADLLAARVGAEAVALGAAYIGVKIGAPGVIEHSGPFARIRFGALQAAQLPVLQSFQTACTKAGIDAQMPADIRSTIWEKFVFLVGLSSLTALTRQPIGVTRDHPELRRLLRQVMDEAARLAQHEGATLATDYVDQQMAFVDTMPADMKASMLHDLEAGRPLELPWLAAAVVRRSERFGLDAPACRFIAAALAPYAGGTPRSA